MKNPLIKPLIELHIAVFLFGFTAILGELILLHPVVLTMWRVILASIVFLFIPKLGSKIRALPRHMVRIYFGIGIVVALHWLTFYASIKAANASVALVCLALTTFFTSIIEPFVMKQRRSRLQMAIGLCIIPGMVLIVNATGTAYIFGIGLGILSALLAATFGALNKKYIGNEDAMVITFIEMSAAAAILVVGLPLAWWYESGLQLMPSTMDWIYLIILAVLCTNVAYLLALRVLRHLSAYQTALTINLEPIYGMILAAIILQQYEELNIQFYIGAAIIVGSVLGYPVLRRWEEEGSESG